LSSSDSGRVTVDSDRMHVNREGVTLDTSAPELRYRDSVGGPGPYQTETGSYKVIEYRPGHSR
jgi:hypothetical protein